MSNFTSPSFISQSSVLNPTSFSQLFAVLFVSPDSTGIELIYGSPSMKLTTSFGFIPLNSSTAFTSICANMLLLPNSLFALASYCAFMSVAFTAFSNSAPNSLAPFTFL